MIEIDHVILVVPDLERAADSLAKHHGLGSVPGGRHAGHGTGNRIVPLGTTYLELMAVVDEAEAESSPLGRWALRHTSPELQPAALCLRTDDIGSIAGPLDATPLSMSRLKPDGTILKWRLTGLDGMLEFGMPFFIEWLCEAADHPGATVVEHARHVEGLEVTIGDVDSLRPLLDDVGGLTIAPGSGVLSTVVNTAEGPITFH